MTPQFLIIKLPLIHPSNVNHQAIPKAICATVGLRLTARTVGTLLDSSKKPEYDKTINLSPFEAHSSRHSGVPSITSKFQPGIWSRSRCPRCLFGLQRRYGCKYVRRTWTSRCHRGTRSRLLPPVRERVVSRRAWFNLSEVRG